MTGSDFKTFGSSKHYGRRVNAARLEAKKRTGREWIPDDEFNKMCRQEYADYKEEHSKSGIVILVIIVVAAAGVAVAKYILN